VWDGGAWYCEKCEKGSAANVSPSEENMNITAGKMQEIVEKNTFPGGTVDWPGVAQEINDLVEDALDKAGKDIENPPAKTNPH
jgi:ATP sulfurylase